MVASLKTTIVSCTGNQRRYAVAGQPPSPKLHADQTACQHGSPNVGQRQVPSKHSSVRLAARERASKQLVAMSPKDPRFNDFELARVLFHTNSVKCHANKQRAECWARTHKQRLHYAIATDRISSQALHEKPDIAQDKLTWLQRSDADCGNRYGVLPLCLGNACAGTRTPSSRGLQNFARLPWDGVWLVCYAHRNTHARWQRDLEHIA